jgi:hypothetical protein
MSGILPSLLDPEIEETSVNANGCVKANAVIARRTALALR